MPLAKGVRVVIDYLRSSEALVAFLDPCSNGPSEVVGLDGERASRLSKSGLCMHVSHEGIVLLLVTYTFV